MRILVVEDTDWKFENISEALNDIGNFDVMHEKYRNEALEKIYENNPSLDCIILDMQFPYYKGGEIIRDCGIQILKRMNHRKCNIPVIICSSAGAKIPDDITNVVGYILYGGSGNLANKFKHYLDKIKEEKQNEG